MDKISDRLWKKAGMNNIPLTAAFELLPICNLSCKMCYVRQSKVDVDKYGGLISGKQWLEYAREAKNEGLLYPLLTGGEPFLHPDFREILEGMQNMGMQVNINSNATMIDEETVEWLSKHTPTKINITVYGASEETYQKLCGNGKAFYKMKEAVILLKQYGIPIKFNTSITSENIDDLDQIMEFAREMNVPIQVASYMFPPIRRNKDMIGKNNRLTPQEAGYVKVKSDFLQNDSHWFYVQAKRFQNFIHVDDIHFHQIKSSELKMSCRAGHCSFWIDWKGNMGNCGMYSSILIPLRNQSIHNAWKKIVEYTDKYRYSSKCSSCPNNQLCHTCVAMVNNECGNIDGRPKYICEMNEAAAKYYKLFLDKLMNEGKIDEKKIIDEKVNFDDFDISDDCDMH